MCRRGEDGDEGAGQATLLSKGGFVKAGLVSFDVKLPDDVHKFIVVPCTLKATQQADVTVTVCAAKSSCTAAPAVKAVKGTTSSPSFPLRFIPDARASAWGP